MNEKQLTIPALPNLPTIERELQFDEWAATMRDLFEFENKLEGARVKYQLIVGRAFAYGQERWKRGAEHEAVRIGFALGTLYNWSSVARRISPSIERDDLTFEDYRALAKLENDAEREKWIARKQAEGWSGKRLDVEISRRNAAQKSRQLKAAAEPTPQIDDEPDTSDFAAPDEEDSEPVLSAPTRNVGGTKLSALLQEWQRAAERLQARGDEMSRAQADVYFDCAAQLRETIGRFR